MPKIPKVVIVRNPDGSLSSERTKSFEIDGRETVIPTLVEGRQLSDKQAVDFAIKSGLVFPSFGGPDRIKRAREFAAERSRTGGAGKHGFLGKVRAVPETTAEYQKRTFPARVKKVKETAGAALKADKAVGKGYKGLTRKQRVGHQKALAAAERVEARMGIGKQKKESVQTVVRPDKKKGKSTPASRRRVIEDATGTGVIKKRLEGVRELAEAAGK